MSRLLQVLVEDEKCEKLASVVDFLARRSLVNDFLSLSWVCIDHLGLSLAHLVACFCGLQERVLELPHSAAEQIKQLFCRNYEVFSPTLLIWARPGAPYLVPCRHEPVYPCTSFISIS